MRSRAMLSAWHLKQISYSNLERSMGLPVRVTPLTNCVVALISPRLGRLTRSITCGAVACGL